MVGGKNKKERKTGEEDKQKTKHAMIYRSNLVVVWCGTNGLNGGWLCIVKASVVYVKLIG